MNTLKIDVNVPIYIVTSFSREFFDDLFALKKEHYVFELLNKPVGQEQILAVTKSALDLER